MRPNSYTNTSLGTARRCPREYDLRYVHRLERAGDEREVLRVGQCWHKAHEVMGREKHTAGAYRALEKHAPSPLWNVKLSRMFAAHGWYWASQPLRIVEPEHTFDVEFHGTRYRGQIDGIVELEDGRRGVLELKTAGEEIEGDAPYWSRLRLDVQVGLYYLAAKQEGWEPSFIAYDVARKPTIRPKAPGLKKERQAWKIALENGSESIEYFGEDIPRDEALEAIAREHESPRMYGARLTADIGNNPAKYFQRREVPRMRADFEELLRDMASQVDAIERAHVRGHFQRNPDQCNAFGRCDFLPWCSMNFYPVQPYGAPPEGFQVREHLHPELEQ